MVARYDQNSFIALLSNHNKKETNALLDEVKTLVNHKLNTNFPEFSCKLLTGIKEKESQEELDDMIFKAFADLHEF